MMWLLLAACARDPNAPPSLAYDHVACSHCSMLVSEPRYAAALVTRKGETLAFDDAGCLFRYVVANHPSVEHLWFHGEGDAWFTEADVGFTVGGLTPMGSGLTAVPAGTPGSLSVGEASSRALEAR